MQTAILRLLRPTSLYFTCTSAAGHILTCHSMPHQKCLFPWRSRPPTSTWFLTGPIPVYIPIGISISSSVFAELSRNQQPDRPCYSVCSNRPHSRDLSRMRPKYLIKQVFCCFVFNMFTLKPKTYIIHMYKRALDTIHRRNRSGPILRNFSGCTISKVHL